jgi:hypothetical protein
MASGLYYGFWDYWELRHKVTFDGINKLIIINPGVTELDVQTDIYSDWKEWTLYEKNLKWLKALNTVGGEPTVSGQRLDVTYFLINGWKIKPQPGSYTLTIVGNIFDIDGGAIKVDADIIANEPNNIAINTNTSVIVRQIESAGGGSLTTAQNAALFNIENKVIEIESILQQPVSASLVTAQEQALLDIQAKMAEVWQLHGLDDTSPLSVTQTTRTFGEVTQVINTTGSGSSQETTILRI